MAYHQGKMALRDEPALLEGVASRIESLVVIFMDEYNHPEDDAAIERAVEYLTSLYGDWFRDFYDEAVHPRVYSKDR